MKEHEEILIRKSRMNPRRVVLLYWFSFIFLGTTVAIGLGTEIFNPRLVVDDFNHMGVSIPSEFGPEDCTGSYCHNDTVAHWNETGHSRAGTLLPNGSWLVSEDHIYNETEFSCMIQCHTTRYNESDGTYWTDAVTCGACHEAPGLINHTGDNCGKCHTHGNSYQDYSESKHASSMEDLLAGGFFTDYCIHCHSGQSTYSDTVLSSDSDIYCGTCHDPHSATNDMQLRTAEVADLCGICHSSTIVLYENISNAHLAVTNEHQCGTCHGYQEYSPYWNPTATYVRVNHTWAINYEQACGQCHSNVTERVEMLEAIQGDIETLLTNVDAQLTNVTSKVDEANSTAGVSQTEVDDAYALIEEAEELYDLVLHDYSIGFHNPTMAEDKLKLSLLKLNEAYAKAVEAIASASTDTSTEPPSDSTTSAGTPGLELLTVLTVLSVLAVAATAIRKKRK